MRKNNIFHIEGRKCWLIVYSQIKEKNVKVTIDFDMRKFVSSHFWFIGTSGDVVAHSKDPNNPQEIQLREYLTGAENGETVVLKNGALDYRSKSLLIVNPSLKRVQLSRQILALDDKAI